MLSCAGNKEPGTEGDGCSQDMDCIDNLLCRDGTCQRSEQGCPSYDCTHYGLCERVPCPEAEYWCGLSDEGPAWTQAQARCDDGDPCTLGDTC